MAMKTAGSADTTANDNKTSEAPAKGIKNDSKGAEELTIHNKEEYDLICEGLKRFARQGKSSQFPRSPCVLETSKH